MIELSSESNSSLNWVNSDSETHEDDQITNKIETVSDFRVNALRASIQVSSLIFRPSITVWQPPKKG